MEYNYDQKPAEGGNPFLSVHLPITLLSLALTLYFALQLSGAKIGADGLDLQVQNSQKLKEALTAEIAKNVKEIEARAPVVAESEKIQKNFAEVSQKIKDTNVNVAQFQQLHGLIAQVGDALQKNETVVNASQELQKRFSDMLKELNDLAKTGDKDAAAVIAAAGIKVNEPAKEEPKPAEKPADKPADAKPADAKPAPKTP